MAGDERPQQPLVDVRRSRRRRRTVSAYRDGDTVVVLLPARFTAAEERRWVRTMLDRLQAQERRRRPGDAALAARAVALSDRYLGGLARPTSVRWASNQRSRWGSTTPADGTIRVSDRLRGVPGWVLDYVLLHELAHLVEPGHGTRFWSLLEDYPRTERARGWLEGYAAGHGAGTSDAGTSDDGTSDDGGHAADVDTDVDRDVDTDGAGEGDVVDGGVVQGGVVADDVVAGDVVAGDVVDDPPGPGDRPG